MAQRAFSGSSSVLSCGNEALIWMSSGEPMFRCPGLGKFLGKTSQWGPSRKQEMFGCQDKKLFNFFCCHRAELSHFLFVHKNEEEKGRRMVWSQLDQKII